MALTAEQREDWKTWLKAILAQKGWRKQLPSGRWQSAYAEFDRHADLPIGTIAHYVQRGYVPSPAVVQRLSAALGVSPFAVLYRSFQISFDQLAALIGPDPRLLVTEDETRATIEALRQTPGLPTSFREQMEHRFLESYRFTREFLAHMQQYHALSDDEFAQLRAFLTERGKEQTRRDVLADAVPLPALPSSPLAAGGTPPDPRDQVFAQPLAPPIPAPFAPESAIAPPPTGAPPAAQSQSPQRRSPTNSPVWQEEEDDDDEVPSE